VNPQEFDPFRCHADWENNAIINNWMQFVDLAECYVKSADALVTSALNDHMLLDVHVHPICFLYRHGLELILKDLTWKSHYLLTGVKRFAEHEWRELGRHGLRNLWKSVVANTRQVRGEKFPLSSDRAGQVEDLLEQFERHDPNSSSFRYPIDKKTGRSHASLKNVNLRVLCETVGEVFDALHKLVAYIDYCYDRQSEWRSSEW
jgi:hypothetical protein